MDIDGLLTRVRRAESQAVRQAAYLSYGARSDAQDQADLMHDVECAITEFKEAAQAVIDNWEEGDLASAVNRLAEVAGLRKEEEAK